MKKIRKEEKGITLIALVVTIIVLLILAGVAITLTVGNNGLFKRAQNAEEISRKEEGREIIKMAVEAMRMDTVEKNIPFTLDYVGDNIAEELKINPSDVSKNGNPTETVTVIYKGYEYEIDDEFEISVLGSKEGRVNIDLTYRREGEKGIITVVASTKDKEGIRKIIKPDGSEQVYTNKEREVTLEYEVEKNGDYKFIGEGNNNEIRSKKIRVLGFGYFSIAFEETDFPTINESYEKGKEEKTEEQNKIINDTNTLVGNNNTISAIKNSIYNTWTLITQSKTDLLADYYLYDIYGVETRLVWEEGPWGDWQGPVNHASLTGVSLGAGKSGWSYYTFDSSTGNFTAHTANVDCTMVGNTWYHSLKNLSSSAGSIFSGRTIRQFQCVSNHNNVPDVKYRDKVAVEKEQNTVTELEGETIAKSGIYPDDDLVSVGDNAYKKYKKKEQVKQYNIQKYVDNEIKTIYNVESGIINTKKIELFENKDKIKIKLIATGTDYVLSISKDNKNWKTVENTLLNGEAEINLGDSWDSMYIRIERKNSKIEQIEVI